MLGSMISSVVWWDEDDECNLTARLNGKKQAKKRERQHTHDSEITVAEHLYRQTINVVGSNTCAYTRHSHTLDQRP